MYNETDIKFGEIIKAKRKLLKWNQEQLGAKVGCTKIMVHYYETGKRGMTISQFFRFCDVLDLKPNDVQKQL